METMSDWTDEQKFLWERLKKRRIVAEEIEEIVLVPVPRRALQAVYSALAKALANENPTEDLPVASSETLEPGTREAKHLWWTDERLSRLRGDLDRFPAVSAVLKLTAEKPEQPISIREVEREAKLNQRQLAAQLAAFTKYCKSTFGRAEWPFEAKWLSGDTRASYVMGKGIADRWQEP
ncbi:MAG: hypothetical protein ABR507_09415 [Actinomycetota bacterium]|nr:hypothetical protein [Actinomycetota bacterium]